MLKPLRILSISIYTDKNENVKRFLILAHLVPCRSPHPHHCRQFATSSVFATLPSSSRIAGLRRDKSPRQERGVWRLLLFGFTEGNQGNKDWKSSSLPSPARDTDFVACSRKRSLSEFASVDLSWSGTCREIFFAFAGGVKSPGVKTP
jgi:hypothetical protein